MSGWSSGRGGGRRGRGRASAVPTTQLDHPAASSYPAKLSASSGTNLALPARATELMLQQTTRVALHVEEGLS